jgi:hypothetical protein
MLSEKGTCHIFVLRHCTRADFLVAMYVQYIFGIETVQSDKTSDDGLLSCCWQWPSLSLSLSIVTTMTLGYQEGRTLTHC